MRWSAVIAIGIKGRELLPSCRDDERARGQVAEPLVALRREYGHACRQAAEE
jgi:hypothetical protein